MFKHAGDFEKICLKLNYQFRDKELLAQAITTKSALHNHLQIKRIGHHEEMAFLGDGILRLIVDKTLLEKFPFYNVGTLSKARDLIVKNVNLSEVAKKLTLEQFIVMDTNQVKQCQQSNPKLLADTIEAIIYAIYKDSGENIQEVKNFIFSRSSISDALEKQYDEEEEHYRPLLSAIQDGNVEQVNEMLETGFPPNFIFRETEISGWLQENLWDPIEALENIVLLTPLEVALKYFNSTDHPEDMLKIVECLFKHGANPNLHIKGKISPLNQLFSAQHYHDDGYDAQFCFTRYQQHKDKKTLETYLEHRNKMIKQTSAIKWNDKITELFCNFGVKLDEDNYSQDNTLLQLAIIHRQEYKIDLLLKYKINPDIQNKGGETALHLAALLADEALTIKLLNAGADPRIADKNGSTPFDVAATIELKQILLKAEITRALSWNSKKVNNEELKQTAINHYQKWLSDKSQDALTHAIQLFTLVLKHNLSSRNVQDMHLIDDFYDLGSAYFERQRYVKAKPLLERAESLYLINQEQFQAQTNKYFDRLTECNKYLEQNNSQTTPVTLNASQLIENDNTPSKSCPIPEIKQVNYNKFDQELFSAIYIHGANSVNNLLKDGANPEAVSEKEEPALHHAIQQYVKTVSMLPCSDPYLGLGFVKRDALHIVETLLAFGADPNQRDGNGMTALHIAAIVDEKLNNDNIIGLLLKYGADPNIRDFNNNFASHYAKGSSTRQLILNALLSAQSIKTPLNSFINIGTIASIKKVFQVEEKLKQIENANKTEIHEVDVKIEEHKQSTSNQTQSPIKPLQYIVTKPFLTKNNKGKQLGTALCKFFKEGKPDSCNKGNQCKFTHGLLK